MVQTEGRLSIGEHGTEARLRQEPEISTREAHIQPSLKGSLWAAGCGLRAAQDLSGLGRSDPLHRRLTEEVGSFFS